MATKRTSAPAADDEEVSSDELKQAFNLLSEDTFSGDSLTPALSELYAQMQIENGSAKVFVTKLDATNGGKEAHVWRGEPEDYDLERIARQFGSGDYRVKVYASGPTGHSALRANKVFTWLLSPEEEERRKNPTGATQSQGLTAADVARIVAETVKANQQPVQIAPPPDPFAMLERMSAIMANLRPQESQVQPTDPLVVMERVLQMQALVRESMPERDDTPVPGGANTNDLLLGLIKNFGPLFAQALAQGQGGIPQEVPTAEAAPQLQHNPQAIVSPVPQSAPVANPQPVANPEGEDVNLKLKMGMNFLIMQCDAGGEPVTYAEVVADSVPAETLHTLVNDSNAINVLINIDKRIEEPTRKAWFEALLAEVKAMMNDEGEDNATPA